MIRAPEVMRATPELTIATDSTELFARLIFIANETYSNLTPRAVKAIKSIAMSQSREVRGTISHIPWFMLWGRY